MSIYVTPLQMSGLSLTPIDGKEVGELTELTPDVLADIDKEGVQYEITVLEEKLAQIKPNMAAIAEYRKKVGQSHNQEAIINKNLNVSGVEYYPKLW